MSEIHAASKPHERFMFNMAVMHFLLPAVLFNTENFWLIVGLPVSASLAMMGWIIIESRRSQQSSELVAAHWRLVVCRCRYLILAYAVSLTIFMLGYLFTMANPDESMRFIQRSVIGWLSLLPLSLTLVVLLVLETSALAQARRQVMPEDMRI